MRRLGFVAPVLGGELLIEVYLDEETADCFVSPRTSPRDTWGPPIAADRRFDEDEWA